MDKTKLVRFRYKDGNINSKKKATMAFFTAVVAFESAINRFVFDLVRFVRLYRCGELWYDFERIAHDTIISHFEKWRFWIFVNHHNGFR